MKWAPAPWKSSDFAPRRISFLEKLCYTTNIMVNFVQFCQLEFAIALSASPQTSLRRKPSPKALPHKALGGQDYYLPFPVRGRKRLAVSSDRRWCGNYYLPFPVRGRKLGTFVANCRLQYYYLPFPVRGRKRIYKCRFCPCRFQLLFTFPRKGTETPSHEPGVSIQLDYYLPFPVRGRKPL